MEELRTCQIEERGIEPPTDIDSMKWKEVVYLLLIDEYKRPVQLKLARDIDHWRMVKKTAPQSDQMMELFEYKDRYFLDKLHISSDKALVIISNVRNFKTRASRDAPIGVF